MAAASPNPLMLATGPPDELVQLQKIRDLIGSKSSHKIVITFRLDGKEHETTFSIAYDPDVKGRENFRIYNGCINLEYRPKVGKDDSWQSSIKKNTNDIKAFKTADAEFGSNLDMLQILTTKLRLCMPGVNVDTIKITDEAKIKPDTSYLSDCKILRGGMPVYEKYGYASDMKAIWTTISTYATTSGNWSQVLEFLKTENEAVTEVVTALAKSDDPRSIAEIMGPVIIGDDVVSTPIVEAIYKIVTDTSRVRLGFRTFKLYPASVEWTTCKNKLIITSVTEVPLGGRRKTNKQRSALRSQSLNKGRTKSNNGRSLQTTRCRQGRIGR